MFCSVVAGNLPVVMAREELRVLVPGWVLVLHSEQGIRSELAERSYPALEISLAVQLDHVSLGLDCLVMVGMVRRWVLVGKVHRLEVL